MASRFCKKPVVIEAVQLCWKNWNEVCDFLGGMVAETGGGRNTTKYHDSCGEESPFIELTIRTLEGDLTACHGDWIIKGVAGEFYPCKPDIFEATYEAVDEAQRGISTYMLALKIACEWYSRESATAKAEVIEENALYDADAIIAQAALEAQP